MLANKEHFTLVNIDNYFVFNALNAIVEIRIFHDPKIQGKSFTPTLLLNFPENKTIIS